MVSELLNTTEAADLLKRPVETLRWWRHTGFGPQSFRLGRRVYYERSAIEGWIAERKAETVAGGAA